MEKEEFVCQLGTYMDNSIVADDGEIIPARAYMSKHPGWNNRYGFWMLKYNPDFEYFIITEYIEI